MHGGVPVAATAQAPLELRGRRAGSKHSASDFGGSCTLQRIELGIFRSVLNTVSTVNLNFLTFPIIMHTDGSALNFSFFLLAHCMRLAGRRRFVTDEYRAYW